MEHISPADLRQRLREIAERTPTSSNRALACLKILCHWGIAEELIRSTPTQGVRPLIRERPRERTLQDAEIRNFWRSLEPPIPRGLQTGDFHMDRQCPLPHRPTRPPPTYPGASRRPAPEPIPLGLRSDPEGTQTHLEVLDPDPEKAPRPPSPSTPSPAP